VRIVPLGADRRESCPVEAAFFPPSSDGRNMAWLSAPVRQRKNVIS
jgi:hypothetical protein